MNEMKFIFLNTLMSMLSRVLVALESLFKKLQPVLHGSGITGQTGLELKIRNYICTSLLPTAATTTKTKGRQGRRMLKEHSEREDAEQKVLCIIKRPNMTGIFLSKGVHLKVCLHISKRGSCTKD